MQSHIALDTRAAPAAEDMGFWEDFDQFALDLHSSLDLNEVLAVAVNDGRRLIGCDRLSVALQVGNRCVIRAVSGQDRVVARSKLVRALAALAREVIRVGEPVLYTGELAGYPPQVESPLADYLHESQARMIAFQPLCEPVPFIQEEEGTSPPREKRPPRTFGCLIAEQSRDSEPRPRVLDRIELLAGHIAAAVHNARTYSTVFLLPLLRVLGRCLGWFRGRRLWASLAIVALLSVLCAASLIIERNYRVEATGKLMPAHRQEVFAPWDGDIVEVFVDDGQQVKQGEPLLRLESDELRSDFVVAQTEVQEKAKLVNSLRSQADRASRSGSRDEAIRLQGEVKRAEIELEGAKGTQGVLEQRLDKLLVRAPMNGVVTAFQVKKLLLLRPVQRGEMLLQVVDQASPWRLELEVPDYRIGHVLRAYHESPTKSLPIRLVLATAVETKVGGTLTCIATRADESEEHGSIVEVTGDIESDELKQRYVGAGVYVQIYCGKACLAYVMFGDVVEFFQRHVWF